MRLRYKRCPCCHWGGFLLDAFIFIGVSRWWASTGFPFLEAAHRFMNGRE